MAIVASHPIQYQAPLFRELASRMDLSVFFAHRATEVDQANAGFGVSFDWNVDLLSGYEHVFMSNVATAPGLDRFSGCNTPEISSRLTNGKFDAVLINGWHLKSYLQAAFVAKRLGLPLLVRGDSHLDTPRVFLKRITKAAAYPLFLRIFSAALYVGEKSHAYWRHYHYPERRLFFSPHCVDTDWFAARASAKARTELRARLRIRPDAKVALFAGKLVPFKRPLDVVAAAALMKAEGSEIVILVAGSGPLEKAMASAARAADVAFHPLGFLNQSEIPAAYAAADFLVLPSDGHETWGLVANEALACGRPTVLASTVGAAPDLAADGQAGRIFPLGDIGALARALKALIDNPPSAELITAKSKSHSVAAAVDGIEEAIISTLDPLKGSK